MKIFALCLALCLTIIAEAQNNSARSSAVVVDMTANKKTNSFYPKIAWVSPSRETTFLQEGNTQVEALIESKVPLQTVTLTVKDKVTQKAIGSTNVPIPAGASLAMKINNKLFLNDGVNQIEITATNADGLKTIEVREVHVGQTALADAVKLGRKDYAVIFATDQYDNWKDLVNPVFDARTIKNSLEKYYGFTVELVENPTQEQLRLKLREYAEKKYNPLDQLFVMIAGHGFYDKTFKEGYVVVKESLEEDASRTSYLPHATLRTIVNNNPCEHVFLVMDVCFGGTFDEERTSRGADDAVYGDASQSEVILRKLQFKTRKYLTSGGEVYVSDGVPGKHSPFAKQFIEALESTGGNDGILTLSELMTYVERLKVGPQYGKFGSDQQGSEFVFVVK